ncbi:MAG: cyclase family protein [Chlorobium sp.]
MLQAIDLSHRIEPGMPCYPGTPGPVFRSLSSIEEDGFSEQLLTLSSHVGTHVDLPSHILKDAPPLDDFGIERFAGTGLAIDVRETPDQVISIEALQPAVALIRECEFLLLCTGWSRYWNSSDYYEGYPVLSIEAARWLAECNLKGVGVDTMSVDAPDALTFPVHKILLQKGTLVIENLAELQLLLHRPFFFCGFPLKLSQAEASPIRAVALV